MRTRTLNFACWLVVLVASSPACSPQRDGSEKNTQIQGDAAGSRAAVGEHGPTTSAAAVIASSGFDTDVDGWTIVGDAQSESVTPDFNGTGGNPGGLITAKDDTTGGTFYFVAPKKYLGDATKAYGKLLTFDLKTTSVASPFEAYGVMLSGGGVSVIAMMPHDPAPAGTWVSYAFTLDSSADWKVVSGPDVQADSSFGDAPRATESQLHTVLGALTLLRIRGEYNDGPDQGSLDNVRFGVDEPATP
jgi:hypothetical protein